MATTKAPRKSSSKRPTRAPQATKGLKTTPSSAPVEAFLSTLEEAVRADCLQLDAWMHEATGSPGVMYGKSIVGYGTRTIRYADGREAPWMKLGFSPRKQALTLYGVVGAAPAALLSKLGKHTTGKECLYVKRLADIDGATLRALLAEAAK